MFFTSCNKSNVHIFEYLLLYILGPYIKFHWRNSHHRSSKGNAGGNIYRREFKHMKAAIQDNDILLGTVTCANKMNYSSLLHWNHTQNTYGDR
jgi:hypothetical protein